MTSLGMSTKFFEDHLATKLTSFQLASCSTDRERYALFKAVLEPLPYRPTPPEHQLLKKDLTKSREARKEGNASVMAGQLAAAVSHYNRAIALAPADCEDLALAFANRSGLLLKAGFIRESLRDGQRALDSGYHPQNLRHKLLRREAQCHAKLGAKDKARACLEKAIRCLASSGLAVRLRKRLRVEMTAEMRDLGRVQTVKLGETEAEEPVLAYGPSAEMPSVSSAVQLCYSQEMGRYCVATRDIKAGDLLVAEHPLIQFLAPGARFTHCVHCSLPCLDLIPCENCAWAMFCSKECQLTSAASHKVECATVPRILVYEWDCTRHALLTLRLLAREGIPQIHRFLQDNLEESADPQDPRTIGFTDGRYLSNLRALYHLCRNSEKLDSSTMTRLGARAWCLAQWLHPLLPDSDLFGAFFLRLQQILNLNCSYMNDIFVGPPGHRQMVYSAIAVPLSIDMFSHACNPNTALGEQRGFKTLGATEPISKGSVITFSNSVVFYNHPKEVRQAICLSKFNFVCKCDACKYDWPQQGQSNYLHSNLETGVGKQKLQQLSGPMFKFTKAVQEIDTYKTRSCFTPEEEEICVQLITELWKLKGYPCTLYNMLVMQYSGVFSEVYKNKLYKFLYGLP